MTPTRGTYLQHSLTTTRGVVVLQLAGDIQPAKAGHFEGLVLDALEEGRRGRSPVLVDLSEIESMDCLAYLSLSRTNRDRHPPFGGFGLVATGVVKHVLTSLGLSDTIPVYSTLRGALEMLGRPGKTDARTAEGTSGDPETRTGGITPY